MFLQNIRRRRVRRASMQQQRKGAVLPQANGQLPSGGKGRVLHLILDYPDVADWCNAKRSACTLGTGKTLSHHALESRGAYSTLQSSS